MNWISKCTIVSVVAMFFAAIDTSFAQSSFTNTPQDTIIDNLPLEAGRVLEFNQQPTTPDTLYLAWQQVSVLIPAQWEAFLCDYGNCYTTLPVSGAMYPVLPGGYGLMSLHVKTHVNYGVAIIRYAVWDIHHPLQKDTITWIINSNTTGVEELTTRSLLYAKNKSLVIDNSSMNFDRIGLYDMTGRLVLQKNINSGKEAIDLSFLKDGVYTVITFQSGVKKVCKIYIGQ